MAWSTTASLQATAAIARLRPFLRASRAPKLRRDESWPRPFMMVLAARSRAGEPRHRLPWICGRDCPARRGHEQLANRIIMRDGPDAPTDPEKCAVKVTAGVQ
jgi:hypothetical protein